MASIMLNRGRRPRLPVIAVSNSKPIIFLHICQGFDPPLQVAHAPSPTPAVLNANGSQPLEAMEPPGALSTDKSRKPHLSENPR